MSLAWFQAARAGDLLALTAGLDANLRSTDWRGRTALYYATAFGHEMAAFALYDECGAVYSKAETALELAVYTNQPRVFSRLACSQMERKASRLTPLMRASFEADEEAFDAHISEMQRRDARGLPALFYAACGDDSEARQRILARLRPIEGDIRTYDGRFSMLMAAAYYGNLNAVKEFAYQAGQTSVAGETALMLACRMGLFGDIMSADVPLAKRQEIKNRYMEIIEFMFHTGKIFEMEVCRVSHSGLTATEAFLTWMMDERFCGSEMRKVQVAFSTLVRTDYSLRDRAPDAGGGAAGPGGAEKPGDRDESEGLGESGEPAGRPARGEEGEEESGKSPSCAGSESVSSGAFALAGNTASEASTTGSGLTGGSARPSPSLSSLESPRPPADPGRAAPPRRVTLTRTLPGEGESRRFTSKPSVLPTQDVTILSTLYFCEMGMVTPAFFKKINAMADKERLGKALGLVTSIDLNPLSLFSSLDDPDRLRAILKDTYTELARVQTAEQQGEAPDVEDADPPGLEASDAQARPSLAIAGQGWPQGTLAVSRTAHEKIAIKCIDVMLTVNARGRNALEEAMERGRIESFSILHPLLGRDSKVDDLMVVAFVDTECKALSKVPPETIRSLAGRYDRLGRSAIFYSIYGNNLGTFSILYPYQKTMLLDNFMGGMGGAADVTVLMLSIKLCRYNFVSFILEQERGSPASGGVLQQFDTNGLTALHYALVTFIPEDLLLQLYAIEGPICSSQGVSLADFMFDEATGAKNRAKRTTGYWKVYNGCRYRAVRRNAGLLGIELPAISTRRPPVRRVKG